MNGMQSEGFYSAIMIKSLTSSSSERLEMCYSIIQYTYTTKQTHTMHTFLHIFARAHTDYVQTHEIIHTSPHINANTQYTRYTTPYKLTYSRLGTWLEKLKSCTFLIGICHFLWY